MANKRMFSKQITTSDAFVEMPVSSQLLYFHLNMEADDDGFVANPKRIMRMLNVNDDDLKILLAKRFLLAFESGVVVIKHWLLHNAVRKDMYKETQYTEEKNMLQIKDNGVYTEVRNGVVTDTLHRLDQDRIEENRIEENKEDKDTKPKKSEFGEFKNVLLTEVEYKKLIDLMGERNTSVLIEELSTGIESKGYKYKSHYATILNWARRKAQDYQKNKKQERQIV